MTTELRFDSLELPMADLGPENPLPDMKRVLDPHARVQLDDSIPEEQRPWFDYGKVHTILPSRIHDGYSRRRETRRLPTVVLENRYLTATFPPQYGGKLWALRDRETGRDLLHANPVFQPANLALRNAWTSGGVEWNFGMTGHGPFTLAPLHTAILELEDGTPVLRMYEWERIREVSFQLDCWLPEDSRVLYVRVRLVNTRGEEVPVYWWSNMAVELGPDVRVLAPTKRAYTFGYGRGITLDEIPMREGIDLSYAHRGTRSMDWFFDIPESRRKWEAALDGEGYGLIHASTARLIGRKLFMWGEGSGGQRWQAFLAEPGRAYLETQAGLAKTQMQHIPMPAGAVWDWLEAYGALEVEPEAVHGEWLAATEAVEAALDRALPQSALDETLESANAALARVGEAAVARGWGAPGSGWAALELRRQAKLDGAESMSRFAGEHAVYGGLGEEQAPWLALLEEGALPEGDPDAEPWAYLVQAEWRALLEDSIEAGASDHWQGWLQLGVMAYAAGDVEAAREAFARSDEKRPNAWAKRNLAALHSMRGEHEAAAAQLRAAYQLRPIAPLGIELGQALIAARQAADFLAVYDGMPEAMQQLERMRVLSAHAALASGELERAEAVLVDDTLELADLREGEVLLSELWIELQMKRHAEALEGLDEEGRRAWVLEHHPIPARLDYRMRT